MAQKELYYSVDIEADGPMPGPYSMLSFGAVAFDIVDHKIQIVDTFEANLERLPDARQHPDTMEFWSKFPKAYKACRKNIIVPKYAMESFQKWVDKTSGSKYRPVMVEYPGDYDMMWIYWYSFYFMGKCPFGFCGYSMKSYANAVLKHRHFHSTNKRDMPKDWLADLPHTHVALDDALEQAHMFVGMRKTNLHG